ncbi:hypothetical protein [Streptomyces sp. NPDC002547]
MNWTKNTPAHHRSLRWILWARHWRELYAWLVAGLLLTALVLCGGHGFEPHSPWDAGLGLVALAAVRTGLVRWADTFTGRKKR